MEPQDLIDALRNRARKFVSLDTPKDADLGDMAADIGAGFLPGIGTALSARDFERARREDDMLGMALSSLGAIPVLGGVTRAANKARKGDAVVDALRKAEPVGSARAKLARTYPALIPPVMAVGPKNGKEYLAKQLSPEAMAVEKVRKAAQKDIDKGNYTPYFDVEKRFYADPNQYPLRGRTLTDALPKKQETINKWQAKFDTPEIRQRLMNAYNRGAKDPLTKDWYAMGQLEQEFIKEYGPEQGRRLFKEAFADSMAATTGGADPTSNLLMSYYGNFLRQKGQAVPQNAYSMPYPIGGRFASGNMAMYDKVINQGAGFEAAKTPKRFNFSADFLGHRDRGTIDEQMMTGFNREFKAPPGDSYGVVEGVVQDLARQIGVPAANFQDVTWAGLKGSKGKPMIQHVNEAIERTARVTGKSPQDVVRDSLVRRTHPLYGIAGTGLTAGALAAALRDQDGEDM